MSPAGRCDFDPDLRPTYDIGVGPASNRVSWESLSRTTFIPLEFEHTVYVGYERS